MTAPAAIRTTCHEWPGARRRARAQRRPREWRRFRSASDTNGSIRVPSFAVRRLRSQADLWAPSADAHVPVLRQPRPSRLVRTDGSRPRARLRCACRVSIRMITPATPRAPEPTLPSLKDGLKGLRVAIAGGYFDTTGLAQAHEAVDAVARALGADGDRRLEGAAEARAAAFLITNSGKRRAAPRHGCGPVRTTSTRIRVTGSSPGRCCPRPG